MKTKAVLEFADVKRMAAAAEAEALAHQWAVSIAIVDDGGHLLWLQRLDGAAASTAQMAPAKAHASALGRRESRVFEELINGGRVSFLSAPPQGVVSERAGPARHAGRRGADPEGRPVPGGGGGEWGQVARGRPGGPCRHRGAGPLTRGWERRRTGPGGRRWGWKKCVAGVTAGSHATVGAQP